MARKVFKVWNRADKLKGGNDEKNKVDQYENDAKCKAFCPRHGHDVLMMMMMALI